RDYLLDLDQIEQTSQRSSVLMIETTLFTVTKRTLKSLSVILLSLMVYFCAIFLNSRPMSRIIIMSRQASRFALIPPLTPRFDTDIVTTSYCLKQLTSVFF